MSEYPLFELVKSIPNGATPMAIYLRDHQRTREEIETRRKAELKRILAELLNGKPVLVCYFELFEITVGDGHDFSYLPRLVNNPEFFDHHKSRQEEEDEKKNPPSAEDKHVTYLRLAEARIAKELNKFNSGFFPLDEMRKQEIEGWIEEIETRPSLSSIIDIVDDLIKKPDFYSTEYGKGKDISTLKQRDALERRRFSAHPKDKYIESNIFDVVEKHVSRKSYADEWAQNEYLFEHEIELRRLTEITKVLTEWKSGMHPLYVLQNLLAIGLRNSENLYDGFDSQIRDLRRELSDVRNDKIRQHWTEDDRENRLAFTLEREERLLHRLQDKMREMKHEVITYRGVETNPQFAEQIDAYIAHIDDSDEHSLDVIRNIFEAMLDLSAPTLSVVKDRLSGQKQDVRRKFDASKPMGPLVTQNEDETRLPLKEIFARRARRISKGYKALPKIIGGIQIDASGSGAIKPYSKITIGRDRDGKLYKRHNYDSDPDERYNGTTIARVTTYLVTLTPDKPENLMRLRGYVQWALKQMIYLEGGYDSPFDLVAKRFAYARPARAEYNYYSKRKFDNIDVGLVDGKVQVVTKLDLDDVWNLYYLLEDIIEPNEQIAHAMNMARRAEERGMMEVRGSGESKYSIEDDYANENLERAENRMGSLDSVDYEDFVPESIDQTLKLYALGQIGEKQLLQRVIELSQDTLSGRMVDKFGLLPSFPQLTDGAAASGKSLMTNDQALIERSREILMLMTGTMDKDHPLFPALIAKVQEISRPLRDKLRGREHDRWNSFFSRPLDTHSSRDFSGLLDGFMDDIEDFEDSDSYIARKARNNANSYSGQTEKIQTAYDTLEKWKARREKEENKGKSDAEKEQRSLARQANIALRSPDVGHTSNRSWRDTDYVSRAKDSLWVRKDLPAALEKFMKRDQRPDMRSAMLMITSEHGLK